MPMDAKFVVGLAEMDSQHRCFFVLLDDVEAACAKHHDEGISILVGELVRYAVFHFASEEALMAAYNYPGEAHKAEHAKLLAQVQALCARKPPQASSLRLFLYNCIVNHIELVDRELATFVVKERARIRSKVEALLVAPRG